MLQLGNCHSESSYSYVLLPLSLIEMPIERGFLLNSFVPFLAFHSFLFCAIVVLELFS